MLGILDTAPRGFTLFCVFLFGHSIIINLMITHPDIQVLGIIAGNGTFPETLIQAAKKKIPHLKVVVAGFVNETKPDVEGLADEFEWFRVGQLSKPLAFFKKHGVENVMMAGGIAPKNLFDMRPDLKALMLLAKLKKRNAETLFTAIADFMEDNGVHVLLSTSFMEDHIPSPGHIYGPKLKERRLSDVALGVEMSKEMCRLYIGQCVTVRHGTVLSVEAFESTNDCLQRGGSMGKGKDVTAVKLCKLDQDMRFDAPCVGAQTIESCHNAGVSAFVVYADKTLILEKEQVAHLCDKYDITLMAVEVK